MLVGKRKMSPVESSHGPKDFDGDQFQNRAI